MSHTKITFSKKNILLTALIVVCVPFAGVHFVNAQLNSSGRVTTVQKPVNIRGAEVMESEGPTLHEPCTLLPIAHVTHGSDSVNSLWAEYDLGTPRDVTAVLLDNSQSTNTNIATYTVYTGTTSKPAQVSGTFQDKGTVKQGIYIPFSSTAKQTSFVRVEQVGDSKDSSSLEHTLICSTGRDQSADATASAKTAVASSNPVITTPPNPNCPGGDLYLNKTELLVGETLTAIAPPMWYDGSFASSNTGVVVIDGNIVRAVAPGAAKIYGTDFKGGNSRGCVTKAVMVTVK